MPKLRSALLGVVASGALAIILSASVLFALETSDTGRAIFFVLGLLFGFGILLTVVDRLRRLPRLEVPETGIRRRQLRALLAVAVTALVLLVVSVGLLIYQVAFEDDGHAALLRALRCGDSSGLQISDHSIEDKKMAQLIPEKFSPVLFMDNAEDFQPRNPELLRRNARFSAGEKLGDVALFNAQLGTPRPTSISIRSDIR